MLKGLTWQYVIESQALITQRYGHQQLVRSLFGILCEAGAREKDRRIFPAFYRELLGATPDNATVVRTVADLISSMTESQVIAMHHRLTGISLGGSVGSNSSLVPQRVDNQVALARKVTASSRSRSLHCSLPAPYFRSAPSLPLINAVGNDIEAE